MNWYLLIPFFIIIIILLPVFIKVRSNYNLFENNGSVAFFIFEIKIISLKFSIDKFGIKIYKNKKIKNEKIDFGGEEAVFVSDFIKQLKDKTHLKTLKVFYNIGFKDAFDTAMFCGFVNLLIELIFTRIKSIKPTATLFLGDNIAYNQNVFQLVCNFKISISLFDIVYSFLNSVILSLGKSKI